MSTVRASSDTALRRRLRLFDLVVYGIILIQPTAPMPLFGVVSQEARGHVVLTILIAMAGMLFTAISYGRMARAYPSAGSAYAYVGRELHPALGYASGWSMLMDYMLNPVISTIWAAKSAGLFLPEIPYWAWATFFALLFTALNLRGIEASARTNTWLAAGLGVVVVLFVGSAVRHLAGAGPVDLTRPFYDPATFAWPAVMTGTSIAALTYIGFDGISTLSEEVENPRRNILLATVLTCLVTGVLAGLEVYLGQLVWPDFRTYPDPDTAFVSIAARAGGAWLGTLINAALLIATIGAGTAAQLGAARIMYGMGRDDALPRGFFGAVEPKRGIPRNNVLLLGAVALAGAFLMSYQLGAELLNFGAFLAFMGVNAAAFVRYWVRKEDRNWSTFAVPLLGFALSFWIWMNLRTPAKLVGAAWLLAGMGYGLYRLRPTRRL